MKNEKTKIVVNYMNNELTIRNSNIFCVYEKDNKLNIDLRAVDKNDAKTFIFITSYTGNNAFIESLDDHIIIRFKNNSYLQDALLDSNIRNYSFLIEEINVKPIYGDNENEKN